MPRVRPWMDGDGQEKTAVLSSEWFPFTDHEWFKFCYPVLFVSSATAAAAAVSMSFASFVPVDVLQKYTVVLISEPVAESGVLPPQSSAPTTTAVSTSSSGRFGPKRTRAIIFHFPCQSTTTSSYSSSNLLLHLPPLLVHASGMAVVATSSKVHVPSSCCASTTILIYLCIVC